MLSFNNFRWPWEAVRNKLVEALTEMTVLTDVIAIATKECGKDSQVPSVVKKLNYFIYFILPEKQNRIDEISGIRCDI
jgi:hypothetical protein